jgi:biopolymer transport protein ExbD
VASVIVAGSLFWDTLSPDWRWDVPAQLVVVWIPACVATGAALVLLLRFSQRPRFAPTSICPAFSEAVTTLGHLPRLRRLPFRAPGPIRNIGDIGMYVALLLMLVMFVFMVLGTPPTPHGLLVRLNTRAAGSAAFGPASETLGVYVDGNGEFHVNGSVVEQGQLRARLTEELHRRTTPIVYFEANDNIEVRRAIFAFDAIKSAGGQLFWITPELRKQSQQTAAPPSSEKPR